MTNTERRQLLDRFRSSGMGGSILDVYQAHAQGVDLIGEHERSQAKDQPVTLTGPEEQREGLRPYHAAGDLKKTAVFKDVPPNTPFNTQGMKIPIDITKVNEQGHIIESHKSIPPGVRNIPTGPYRGDIIETPAKGYQKGGFINKKKKARSLRDSDKAVYVKGQKKGSSSTHLMVDDIKDNPTNEYHVWPSITLDDSESGYSAQTKDQAKERGEYFTFKNKKRAEKFAHGSWKKGKDKREAMKDYRASKKQTGGFRYIPSEAKPLESSSTRVNIPNLPQETIQLISKDDERNFSRSPAVEGQARLRDSDLEAVEANEALPFEERSYPSEQDYIDAGTDPTFLPTAEDVHKARHGEGHAVQSVAIAPYLAGPGGLAKAGVRQTGKMLWNPISKFLQNRIVQTGFGAQAVVDAKDRLSELAKGKRFENGKLVDGRTLGNVGWLGLDALMIGGGLGAAKNLLSRVGKPFIYPKGHPKSKSSKTPPLPKWSPYKEIKGAQSKKDFLSKAKNLDDVTEYGIPNWEKVRQISKQFDKQGLSKHNKRFVQEVFDRYSKGGKNAIDYITTRIKELKSPEGMKRLIAQELEYLKKIGWEPHGGLGVKDKTQFINWKAKENALARIQELEQMKIGNVPINNTYSLRLLEQKKFWDNASYFGPDMSEILSADDIMIPLRSGKHSFINAPGQVTGSGVRIGGKVLPSSARIGLPFVENTSVIGHEISGHGLQAKRILKIDDDAIRLLKPKDMDKLPLHTQEAYNYFSHGSGHMTHSMEPSAFLHELRESMLLRGLIKSRYQEITPNIIEAAKISFRNKPMGIVLKEPYISINDMLMTRTTSYGKYLSNTRILDFIQDSKEVTKHLADLLNRLPAIIPVAGATGATAVMSKEREEHRNQVRTAASEL